MKRRALEPYVGKPARIVWEDGTAEVLTIVSVDVKASYMS